jgi:phosphoribosylformimino-5-aminoimidazole carboxamide ribotide isomerase
MQLIPAIDLLDGRCVRLLHGDFNKTQFYAVDPVALASDYATAGAELLHVVNLAAARDGKSADSSALLDLLNHAPMAVQTGGGVRSSSDVQLRLDNGASRVVVGSLCVTETEHFIRWISQFGAERMVAALDVQIGTDGVPWPRIFGWTKDSDRPLWSLLDELADRGLRHLLCTDISRDGAMTGPNLGLYRQLVQRYPQLEIQASGGVSSLEDLRQLVQTGAAAAISGKALLDGVYTVAEGLEALQ